MALTRPVVPPDGSFIFGGESAAQPRGCSWSQVCGAESYVLTFARDVGEKRRPRSILRAVSSPSR